MLDVAIDAAVGNSIIDCVINHAKCGCENFEMTKTLAQTQRTSHSTSAVYAFVSLHNIYIQVPLLYYSSSYLTNLICIMKSFMNLTHENIIQLQLSHNTIKITY